MNLKKVGLTKLFLFILITLSFILAPKKISAALLNEIQDETQDEEADYTENNYGEITTGATSTNKRAKGSNLLSDEAKKEIIDKYAATDEIASEGWGKGMIFTQAIVPLAIITGEDIEGMLTSSSWKPGGFIGFTNNAIASLYNPPISGTQYIANSINNILGKPTYAASTGGAFNNLKGILPLWKTCRNAIYVLFSVFFVIVGLLIMLRIKISPQATITIQNSIPKIIITLILVTFSYAIIGLIIDLTYLVQALLLSLLINDSTKDLLTNIPSTTELIKGSFDTFSSLSNSAMHSSDLAAANTVLALLGAAVGTVIGLFSGGWWALGGMALGATIGLLILSIFALIQIIRFFFGCAKAYITLLIKIVSAPFEIALGAFPNSKVGFGSWFIQTLAYASVFPISLIFLVFLNIICNAVSFSDMWVPGVLESPIVSPFIGSIIGIAGLIILPKLPDLIPEAIFQIKPSPFGKALAEGAKKYPGHSIIGGAVGVAKSGASLAISSGLSQNKYFDKLRQKLSSGKTTPQEEPKPRVFKVKKDLPNNPNIIDQPPSSTGEPEG
jgi:hypothetical protein